MASTPIDTERTRVRHTLVPPAAERTSDVTVNDTIMARKMTETLNALGANATDSIGTRDPNPNASPAATPLTTGKAVGLRELSRARLRGGLPARSAGRAPARPPGPAAMAAPDVRKPRPVRPSPPPGRDSADAAPPRG